MNKEIKIIDLLNMIAEGKELPKKFMYKGHLFYRQKTKGICYRCDELNEIFEECLVLEDLNDTVEIIEEDNNKIEKLIINEAYKFSSSTIKDFTMKDKRLLDSNFKTLSDKINEIIDKINNMEE